MAEAAAELVGRRVVGAGKAGKAGRAAAEVGRWEAGRREAGWVLQAGWRAGARRVLREAGGPGGFVVGAGVEGSGGGMGKVGLMGVGWRGKKGRRGPGMGR